jgi:hypothetical protein
VGNRVCEIKELDFSEIESRKVVVVNRCTASSTSPEKVSDGGNITKGVVCAGSRPAAIPPWR